VSRVVDEMTSCLDFTILNELIVSLYYSWYCFWGVGEVGNIDVGGLTCTGHNSELLNILSFLVPRVDQQSVSHKVPIGEVMLWL
jgi:hypothetical protein